jgi:hypothetical protein
MLVRLQNYESTRYQRIKLRLLTARGTERAICFMGDAATNRPWNHPADNRIMALRSRSF